MSGDNYELDDLDLRTGPWAYTSYEAAAAYIAEYIEEIDDHNIVVWSIEKDRKSYLVRGYVRI